MTDLFKSALGYFANSGSSSSSAREDHEFVGQVVELGQQKLRVKRVLAEGGPLVDVLQQRTSPLSLNQVLQIFYQTCNAVRHMHSQSPPIIHRDLKIENLLLSAKGTIKLCDFGSSTTKSYQPDSYWTAIQRSLIEDEMCKNTTPMYRPPEVLDTYNNYPINEAMDIWALGCVLFLLCFREHPFPDSSKLRILNANYSIPPGNTSFEILHDLIRGMLQVNPTSRPTIVDVVERLQEMGEVKNVRLEDAPGLHRRMSVAAAANASQGDTSAGQHATPNSTSAAPARPPPPSLNIHGGGTATVHPAPPSEGGGWGSSGAGLLTSLRGGAGSLLKRLGDTSSKVMHIAQQTMGKADLDFNYITSRLAGELGFVDTALVVMSYPAEGLESAYRNHVEDVRGLLDARHRSHYAIYNVSGRAYSSAKFDCKVTERRLAGPARRPPCTRSSTSAATCSPTSARTPATSASSTASYIQYVAQMVSQSHQVLPHRFPLQIVALTLKPVPLFTKLNHHNYAEKQVTIPLNIAAAGDVTITVYHARSSFGKASLVRLLPTSKTTLTRPFLTVFKPIFFFKQLTIHLHELDGIEELDRYPEGFTLSLDIRVGDSPSPRLTNGLWADLEHLETNAAILFTTDEELEACIGKLCGKQSGNIEHRKQVGWFIGFAHKDQTRHNSV
ncbi:hypothetical protein HPB48_010384 [Haemaphysalis longicornis]|uniref:Protein kinase domain-containing protein n=1 Tax=Haemaphysalis longicornis TaxID=44386 RepID=A0A9J6FV78_HAELO|nr:hypothetical protein HPB48_010384 [Haemaphysalis longicornis]